MTEKFDLGTIYAAFNLVSALAAVWLMQSVTVEAGFADKVKLLKLGHRAALAAVAVALFANAGYTIMGGTDPRPVDFLLESVLILALFFSGLRHKVCARWTKEVKETQCPFYSAS